MASKAGLHPSESDGLSPLRRRAAAAYEGNFYRHPVPGTTARYQESQVLIEKEGIELS